MDKCVKDYTTINSQPCIEALKNLIKDFLGTFGIDDDVDNMFYYGVFCKPQNYVNFDYDTTFSNKLMVPKMLSDRTINYNDRMKYVEVIINRILIGEMEKPEWMKYVEMNMECTEYALPPSTFLYLRAKQPQYKALEQRIIEFLYSPNMLMTMVKD